VDTVSIGSRPEVGEVKVGDRLLVFEGTWGGPRRDPVPAEVVKASRVWLTLRAVGERAVEWRMRRDTHDEGNQTYPQGNASFVTPEQCEWDERMRAINAIIWDAEIRLERSGWAPDRSRWTPDRREALAELIISLGVLDDATP
jgi:hypothetical protein